MPELEPVDLVLTDPPYGIGEAAGKNRSRTKPFGSRKDNKNTRGTEIKATDYGYREWDNKCIDNDDLLMLLSCGEYACCFGGNYYLIAPSSCWLVWDKVNGKSDFADCELAWTNYRGAVRMIKHQWNGMLRKYREPRYHPTQKPLDVIKWAMQLAPKYNSIVDPFMGSGTTLVAAKQLNRKAIGIEIEEKYCEIAVRRLAQEVLEFK